MSAQPGSYRHLIFCLAVLFATQTLLAGCDDDASPELEPTRVIEASDPVCPSPKDGAGGSENPLKSAPEAQKNAQNAQNAQISPKIEVFAQIQSIGTAANALAWGDDYLWVVESTSNTVSRFAPESAGFDPYFIDVGDGHNPFEIAVDQALGRAYITNWLTNSLSVADLKNGSILAHITPNSASDVPDSQPADPTDTVPGTVGLDAPQGVAFSDAYIYVANSGYRGPGDYMPGSVAVFERDSLDFVGNIATEHPNTSFVSWNQTARGPRLIVVNTGLIEVNNEGAFVRGAGSVEVWEERDNPLRPTRESFTVDPGSNARVGAPARAVIGEDGRFIYVASATAPLIFKLDLAENRWQRGVDDPIWLSSPSIERDGTHDLAIDSRGILYITAFNEDALYLVDTACDQILAGPVDLGQTSAQLEGVQTPLILESADKPGAATLYFTSTLANSLGKVGLEFAP